MMAPLTAIAIVLVPGSAWAQATAMPHSARAAVGTLPLLAALSIGIVVAVGAVVAFLHMTAKDRNAGEYADWTDPGETDSAEEAYDDVQAGDTEAEAEAAPQQDADRRSDTSEEEQAAFADHTIPLARAESAPALPSSGPLHGPRLCGLGGDFSGLMFRVTGSGLMIGRDPSYCQIVFPVEAGEVSRRHCTLRYEADSGLFFLEDHGSSNGTFLSDGQRMQPGKRYPLRSGERFAVSGDIHWFAVRS